MSSVVNCSARLGVVTVLVLSAPAWSAQEAGRASQLDEAGGRAPSTIAVRPLQEQEERQRLTPRAEDAAQRGQETDAATTDAPTAVPRITVAVLDLRAAEAHVDVANRVRGLLTAAIDAEERLVSLSGDALQAFLDAVPAGKKAALVCSPSTDCIGAIADATDAGYVVFGDVTTEGALTVIKLSAFGPRGGEVIATETVRLPMESAPSTDAPLAPPSPTPPSTAPLPVTKDALEEATHRLVQSIQAAESARSLLSDGSSKPPSISEETQPGDGKAVAGEGSAPAKAEPVRAPNPGAVDPGAPTPGVPTRGEALADAGGEGRSVVPLVVVASTGGTALAGSIAMYGGLALGVAGSIPLVLGTIANAQVAMLEQEALSSPDGIASAENLSAAAALQGNIAANQAAWTGWGQYLLFAGLAASALGALAVGVGTTWAVTSGVVAAEPWGEEATETSTTSEPAADGPVPNEPATHAPSTDDAAGAAGTSGAASGESPPPEGASE